MKNNNILEKYKDKKFDFLFKSALYQKYEIDLNMVYKQEFSKSNQYLTLSGDNYYESEDLNFLKLLFTQKTDIIEYCPCCKENQIIYIKGKNIPSEFSEKIFSSDFYHGENEKWNEYKNMANRIWETRKINFHKFITDENGNIIISAECKNGHTFISVFNLSKNYILQKIGQYPSKADFETYLKFYKKVINDKDFAELKKAIGLASHQIGVGSFVYLRRIFENMILETFQEENKNETIKLEEFLNKRMEERINIVNEYLGNKFNTKIIYKILSKGIHELNDKECIEYFETLFEAIKIILENRLEIKEKNLRETEIKKILNSINSK